jgi:MerR family transcriptional regulator, light-induced transcriptional regulator
MEKKSRELKMISQTPVYNLMVVLKETGLKADVLRVWERRYDLPHPERTGGGHRLYSDYDIATVKWLKNRQAEGLGISRAVQLWKDLQAAGKDPLEERPVRSLDSFIAVPSRETSLEVLARQWLEGCLGFDEVMAEAALNQALALYPIERACSAVLQQGLQTIGEEWYLGKVSIQQEHFASSLAIRRLEALIAAAPEPTRLQTMVVGCAEGDLHVFPVLLLSLYLQRAGLRVIYLGADTPLEQIDSAIAAIHPDLVIFSAQQLVTAANLSTAAAALRERGIPLAYGGLIFNRNPELRERIPGFFLGESLDAAMDTVERLIQAPMPVPPARATGEYQNLAQLIRRSRPLIEQVMYTSLQGQGVQINAIEEVNAFFGTKLAAALDLGDPAFLEDELAWLNGLLTSHHLPADQLFAYLAAYSRSLRTVIGESGSPVMGWIDQYVASHTRAPSH